MNKNKILAGGLFILLAVGCYKDRGNYDYKDVNDFEIVLSPASTNENNSYTINQPAIDTAHFTLKAEVKQTLENEKDNLFFEWISTTTVNRVTIQDTIHAEEITLAFPPGKTTSYSVMCRVKDLTTDIEYYKNITVKTQVPFHDAWLLVHGADGERKLGAIEWDVDNNMRWTEDMLTIMGQQAFPHLTSITYTPMGYTPMEYREGERLLLTSAPDSSFVIRPFDCTRIADWNTMRPINSPNIKIKGKIFGSDVNLYMGFVDESGRFFWGRNMGYFYEAWGNQVPGYHVDRFYINNQGYATLWDDVNKRFMYYNFQQNEGYDMWGQTRQDSKNTAEISYFESIPAAEMQDKEILYTGRGTKSVGNGGDEESTLFIAKDGTGVCYLYQFSYNSKDDEDKDKGRGKDEDQGNGSAIGKVVRDTLHTLRFNERTLFAASDEYNEQLFYVQDNQLFRLNLNNEENINLHNVEGTIKQFAFRLSNVMPGMPDKENMRIIGLVVQKIDGTNEFQEIHMDNAGDVTDVKTYQLDGVTTIIDFTYTNVNRVFL
ncbi:MAG: hypothetical protein K2O69_08135 [Odoribacter sp.]|nr:hypothetical protein [Odoribacter sp.]